METDRVEEGVQEVTGKAAWECKIGKNGPRNPRENSFRKRWCVHLMTLTSQEAKDAGADGQVTGARATGRAGFYTPLQRLASALNETASLLESMTNCFP